MHAHTSRVTECRPVRTERVEDVFEYVIYRSAGSWSRNRPSAHLDLLGTADDLRV